MKTLKFILFMCLIFNFIECKAQLFENSIVAHYSSDSINIINEGVERLYDISGLNQDLIQTISTKRPSLNMNDYRLNGANTINFDGIDDKLISIFTNQVSQGFTVFIAINSPVSRSQTFFDGHISSNRAFLYYNSSSSRFLQNNGVSLNSIISNGQYELSIFEVQFNGSTSKLKKNNELLAEGQTGNMSLLGISLANSFHNISPYLGDFAEMIVYDQVFNNEEGDSITDYVMNKYAAPGTFRFRYYHIPYGFCDTTLSSPNYYTSYLWSTWLNRFYKHSHK